MKVRHPGVDRAVLLGYIAATSARFGAFISKDLS